MERNLPKQAIVQKRGNVCHPEARVLCGPKDLCTLSGSAMLRQVQRSFDPQKPQT